MNNRKLGNSFEKELCEILSKHGFWVHNFAQNQDGQPADVIAVKHGKAYLIDCKVCSNALKGFELSRVEANQELAMEHWENCGNGEGWFAIKMFDSTHMIPYGDIRELRTSKSRMSPSEIFIRGEALERWARKCK